MIFTRPIILISITTIALGVVGYFYWNSLQNSNPTALVPLNNMSNISGSDAVDQNPTNQSNSTKEADPSVEKIDGPKDLVVIVEPYGEVKQRYFSGEYSYQHRIRVLKNEQQVFLFELGEYSYYTIATSSFSFSPNGRYIYFYAYGHESSKNFLIDTTTGKNIVEKYFSSKIYGFEPFWLSQDKVVIASSFSSFGGDGTNAVYLLGPNSSELITLYRGIDSDEYSLNDFVLSSNGTRLTFREHINPSWDGVGPIPKESDVIHELDLTPYL